MGGEGEKGAVTLLEKGVQEIGYQNYWDFRDLAFEEGFHHWKRTKLKEKLQAIAVKHVKHLRQDVYCQFKLSQAEVQKFQGKKVEDLMPSEFEQPLNYNLN